MTFTIRRLGPADAAALRAIRLEAMAQAPEAFGSNLAREASRSDADFAAMAATSSIFAACVGGEVVGMVGIRRADGPREGHKAHLWGMYVRASARGAGVGAALLQAALAAAPQGVVQVQLAVVVDNAAAVALYRRFGFEPYGRAPRALALESGYVDEWLMVRRLDHTPG